MPSPESLAYNETHKTTSYKHTSQNQKGRMDLQVYEGQHLYMDKQFKLLG